MQTSWGQPDSVPRRLALYKVHTPLCLSVPGGAVGTGPTSCVRVAFKGVGKVLDEPRAPCDISRVTFLRDLLFSDGQRLLRNSKQVFLLAGGSSR